MKTRRLPSPPEKERLIFALLIAAALVGAVAAGAGYYYLVHRPYERVAELEAHIRAQGYPLTPAELDAWYPAVPDNENLALYCKRALEVLLPIHAAEPVKTAADTTNKTLDVTKLWFPKEGTFEPGDADLASASEWLDESQEVFTILRSARQYDSGRYALNFEQGMAIELQHLAPLRTLARTVRIHAVTLARTGRDDDAFDALLNFPPIVLALDKEPVLISHLVRQLVASIAIDAAADVISRVELTDTQLQDLRDAYSRLDLNDGLTRALVGEQALTYVHVKRVVNGDQRPSTLTDDVYLTLSPAPLGRIAVVAQVPELLEAHGFLIDLSKRPLHEWNEALASFGARFEKRRYYTLAGVLIPSLLRAFEVPLRVQSKLNALNAAIGVEQYRIAEGELPDTLSNLVPLYLESVPADPRTGEPLLYRKLDTGYVVYTTGPDEVDDCDTWIAQGMPQHDQTDYRIHITR